MDNRRNDDRKFLRFFSRVVDRKTGRIIGYLSDLTTGGALLIGERAVEKDVVLHLRMDVPEDFAEKDSLSFNAQVMWCRPDDEPDFYKIGLRLHEITWEDLALIERLLNEYGLTP